jgi:hypothetical protein
MYDPRDMLLLLRVLSVGSAGGCAAAARLVS